MIQRLIFSLVLFCLASTLSNAQTVNENSGWLMLSNNNRFNDKWGSHLDVQFRSDSEWDGLRNFLFRPGVTYYINDNNNITVGYLLNETFTNLVGASDNQLTEHRIWEQYIFNHKISTLNVTQRLRLEQRFMERYGQNNLFSQRLRYFIRFVLPLQKDKENFDQGFFAALQNELFFNLQSKKELNGHIFDQNRAYLAAGYRFSKKFDLEAGYLNQAVKGARNNTLNNVIQLAVYTRF